jgi:hypothetical protein
VTGAAVREWRRNPKGSPSSAESQSMAPSSVLPTLACADEAARYGGTVFGGAPILVDVRVRSSFCSARPRGARGGLVFCDRWRLRARMLPTLLGRITWQVGEDLALCHPA